MSIILTADKGMAMVVTDKQDYIKKAQRVLEHTSPYRQLTADPTNKHKAKLITLLRKMKTESGMDDTTYRTLYPTGACSPKFYGLQKHTKRTPP